MPPRRPMATRIRLFLVGMIDRLFGFFLRHPG